MASSSFTSNLGLCNWAATDRPKRADFVSDNNIIDSTVGGHIANTAMHLTAAEKQQALEPYTTMIYSGTDTDNRALVTDFPPKLVMVFKKNASPVLYSGGVNIVNCAVAGYGSGGSGGVSITSTGFTVRQQGTASDGIRYSLNEDGCQYFAVIFK